MNFSSKKHYNLNKQKNVLINQIILYVIRLITDYFNNIDTPYTKMGLFKGSLKQIVWIIFRFLFHLFRTIIWLVLLRYCKIWSNRRKSAYKNTVHVQKILGRHKIDLMFQPASDSNFLTMHHSFQDPEYILSKNVTLYCINKREACFVECDPSIDVFNSEISSFVRIAQFKHARNLIKVPIHIFLEIGEKVGKFNGKLIFLTNTGRCGSTLLSQVFEETEECVSISEPDATNRLTNIRDKIPMEEFDDLARATINLLCKNAGPKTECFVIKLLQPNIPLVPHLARLYPDARHIFMYRDGIYVARSVARIIQRTPLTSLLITLAKNCVCMRLGRILSRAAGLPIDDYDQFETIHDPLQYGTVMWAASIRRYLDYLDNGLDIAAVRYEDMVADTEFAMEQIFKFSQLAYNQEAVERAFSRDSQRGSPISKEKLGQFDHLEITDRVRQLTDYCCEVFEVPSIFQSYIAKNTISHRPISQTMLPEVSETMPSETLVSETMSPQIQNSETITETKPSQRLMSEIIPSQTPVSKRNQTSDSIVLEMTEPCNNASQPLMSEHTASKQLRSNRSQKSDHKTTPHRADDITIHLHSEQGNTCQWDHVDVHAQLLPRASNAVKNSSCHDMPEGYGRTGQNNKVKIVQQSPLRTDVNIVMATNV